MTTTLASEPKPGDGQVPFMSELVDRLYHRMPEIYRTMDARDATWSFKRYLAGALEQAGLIDATVTRIAGDEPVGPATPEPIALPEDQLAVWRAARTSRRSALGDPVQADPEWLPWLAQMIGAQLDPAATLAEKRDTISFATSGYRAGTRRAIEDAARSALTGSRYVRAVAHVVPDVLGLIPGTPWDLTIVTRASETPDPVAVLDTINRKGVKPAGVELHHKTFEATWDAIEAQYPTWTDRDAATWNQIEEAGLTYADVPDNLAVNPSFETNAAGWSAVGSATVSRVSGGVDGGFTGRVTSTQAATPSGIISTDPIGSINDERTYVLSCSIRPHVALTGVELKVEWYSSAPALISTTSVSVDPANVGVWNRVNSDHLAPVGAVSAKISIVIGTVVIAEYADIDAILFRLV